MQIKKSFCPETLKKILKGALIAFTGAGSIAVLQYFGQLDISNPMLASFVAWVVPVATNAINEWWKGE